MHLWRSTGLAAALLGVLALAGGACSGRKAPPPRLDDGSAPTGTWFLGATLSGPVQARLTFEGDELSFQSYPDESGSLRMRFSPDQGEWEARAASGVVIRLAPRGDGLFLYDGLGQVGFGWRVSQLPPRMGGRWILRTIDGRETEVMLLLRGRGEPSLMTLDNQRTVEVWPLDRAEVTASWVRMEAEPVVETLHPVPGGAWLVHAQPGVPAKVLYRPGERPVWLPPVSTAEPPDDDPGPPG